MVAETYLAEVRESESFVYVLVDIIDLRGKFWHINVEMTWRMSYQPEQG